MCGGSKSNLYPLEMEGKREKSCSKLLELAATDDLAGFIHEVEEKGSDVNEVGFWYCRSFDSKKMGFEERTATMIASMYGSTEVLKYLIKTCKVDVNQSCGGATALRCGVAGGAWSSVELLTAAGAEDDQINGCVKKHKVLKNENEYSIPLPDINGGVYGSDEFRMYSFKVKPCSRAYTHDWTECPFAHPGENARRRDPMKCGYSCVPCNEFKKGSCVKGDGCEFAHGVFESWLHPAQYRTRLCKDETGCSRKVCFFAHKPDELRPLYASTGSAMNLTPSILSPMWQSKNRTSLDMHSDSDLDSKPTNLDELYMLSGMSSSHLGTKSLTPSILPPMWQSKIKTSSASALDLDLNPNNLDELYMLSGMSGSHLRARYPSCSPARNPAAAVMNSRRSTAFSNRSHSFIDRAGGSYSFKPLKLSDWRSPDGKLDWGFSDEDASKLRKSASFGFRGGDGVGMRGSFGQQQPHWMDQMYMDQEQMVA